MGRIQEHKSPQISQIRPHHRSMARALVAGGLTPKQLALSFGFTFGHVSRILQTPLFEAEVDRLTRMAEMENVDIRQDLAEMGERSLEVLDEDIHIAATDAEGNPIPLGIRERYLRNKSARDVLDRIGLRKESNAPTSLHLHKHDHRSVEAMSGEELREEVMDLVKTAESVED